MTYLLLFWEFFKTGLFSIGGGLATLPYLYEMSVNHPEWFTATEISNMVAVSESTPGPIGVNMATFAGFNVGTGASSNIFGGMLGALIATLALVLPSVIIITLIAKFLNNFSENEGVKSTLYGLRPAALAFLAVIAIKLFIDNVFLINSHSNYSIVMFALLMIFTQIPFIKKWHPLFIILLSAIITMILP